MIAKGRCCQTRQWEVTNEMKGLALQSGPGRIESNGNRQKLKCLDSQNPIPFMQRAPNTPCIKNESLNFAIF